MYSSSESMALGVAEPPSVIGVLGPFAGGEGSLLRILVGRSTVSSTLLSAFLFLVCGVVMAKGGSDWVSPDETPAG